MVIIGKGEMKMKGGGRERDGGAAEPLRTNKGRETAQLDDGMEPSYREKIDGEKDRMEKVTVGRGQGGY